MKVWSYHQCYKLRRAYESAGYFAEDQNEEYLACFANANLSFENIVSAPQPWIVDDDGVIRANAWMATNPDDTLDVWKKSAIKWMTLNEALRERTWMDRIFWLEMLTGYWKKAVRCEWQKMATNQANANRIAGDLK